MTAHAEELRTVVPMDTGSPAPPADAAGPEQGTLDAALGMDTAPEAPDEADRVQELLDQVRAQQGKSALGKLPKKLSPSRAKVFKECPQRFFFETICGLRDPSTPAQLRGSVAHYVFERVFDHPAGERTVELALTYVEPGWQSIINPDLDACRDDRERERKLRERDDALAAVPPGSEVEQEMLAFVRRVVTSWFDMERVNNFTPVGLALPDGRKIDGRELYALAKLAGVTVHGFIDRLDRWESADGTVHWSVSDYKTSACAPWEKKNYPPPTKEKIRHDNFFQLRVYAALLWRMLGIKVELLRLVYVATGDRVKGIGTERVTEQSVNATIAELERIGREVRSSARTGTWPTKTGPLCQWCPWQDICPAWSPEISDIVTEVARSGAAS